MSQDWAEMMEKTHVVYLHETARESWARDAGTFVMIVALWSLGWFADSNALMWVGVLMGLVFIFFRAVYRARSALKTRMTPTEARAWLETHFPDNQPKEAAE